MQEDGADAREQHRDSLDCGLGAVHNGAELPSPAQPAEPGKINYLLKHF